jgi:formylglycine-generating enzyme required for sulfatase activity
MTKAGIFISLSFISFSFQSVKPKKFIPPGTVQVSETLFADETEISNLSWREYEFWTSVKFGSGSPEHLAVMPDSTVWLDSNAYNGPYAKYYYRHVSYRDYPVVGVSYEQAVAFCKWRTQMVKHFGYIRNKKELNIEYRLPTVEEWETISSSSMSATQNNGRDEKGRILSNHHRPDDTLGTATMAGNADVTAPVYSYWPNKLGLYNTVGNVAEMVSEKGISKGGSWYHILEKCRVGKNIPYTNPRSWLGFRCICVVKAPGDRKSL